MAPLLEDPRIRQTWNQISQNAESATESAAAGIWSVQHNYIYPCFSSTASALTECTAQCFPDRDERARRLRDRGRARGRAELNFDFYDDWNEDEDSGGRGLLGGWGNDELDRLLAGSGSRSSTGDGTAQAPRRNRGMSYGTRGSKSARKSLEPDPTIIPSTSALGFLGRLPFKLGGTLRYKPSAADLQEHPGASRGDIIEEEEGEPLIPDGANDEERNALNVQARQRSSTASSGETSDSFRSRGDLFPSDGEDDAVPLPDEFTMALDRKTTNSNIDDRSSGKTRSSRGKRPVGTRSITDSLSRATLSSQSLPGLAGHRTDSEASLPEIAGRLSLDMAETPSLKDLQQEEERLRLEEDKEVERKRQAAAKLALERGLRVEEAAEDFSEHKDVAPVVEHPPQAVDITLEHAPDADDGPTASKVHHTGSGDSSKANAHHGFIPARLPNFG